MAPFGAEKVNGFSAGEFNVGARCIEMGVVGDDVAFLTADTKENAFSGAALMGWDHAPVPEDGLNGIAEVVEAATAGIALIAFHHGGPLVRGHGAGPGVGQQVDEHVIRGKQEDVEVGCGEDLLALGACGPVDGLDTLDAEGLDDGAERHRKISGCGTGSS